MTSMTLKKAFGLICCTALMLTFAGCNKKNNNTVKPVSEGSGVAATTTALVTQTGEIGEKSEMADVEIKVNKIYRSEYFGSQDGHLSNVIFLDVTVSNNTEKDLDANMLTSFDFEVDGELHDSATLLAISSAKKQFGNDVNLFSNALKPGESQSGIIPAELPRNLGTVTLSFLPLGGVKNGRDTSKAIVYTFTKDDLEDIAKPDSVESTEPAEDPADE